MVLDAIYSQLKPYIMAFSKAHRFEQSDFHFSLVCHALSHPARIAILRMLQEHSRLPVNRLRQGIPLGNSAFSQHLKILREMHILQCEEKFLTIYYWLNPEVPETQSALKDLLNRSKSYFPQTNSNELSSIAKMKGELKPF